MEQLNTNINSKIIAKILANEENIKLINYDYTLKNDVKNRVKISCTIFTNKALAMLYAKNLAEKIFYSNGKHAYYYYMQKDCYTNLLKLIQKLTKQ